jgi:hypothetical protein
MVSKNPKALLIRLNKNDLEGTPENIRSTISFNEEMTTVINDIALK